jgi:DNA-binding IclR family transcriptional regulator
VINSVLKAIDVLSLFSSAEPRIGLTEISRRLDLPKSTVHNLLTTLLSRGFVEKVEGDQYALGTTLIRLTQAVRVNAELRDRAAPLLRRLADESRESAYLAMLDGGYCLYIYAIESPRRLRMRTAVGDLIHPHCTSLGKAMLAYLEESQTRQIVSQLGLPSFTANTVTDPEALWSEMAETRERGYALDREEHERGTFCIGAPIFDQRARVIAACSISGTDPDLIGGRVQENASRVVRAAEDISRCMGFVQARSSLARRSSGI